LYLQLNLDLFEVTCFSRIVAESLNANYCPRFITLDGAYSIKFSYLFSNCHSLQWGTLVLHERLPKILPNKERGLQIGRYGTHMGLPREVSHKGKAQYS
jgi:hypothetical protein